MKRKVVLSILLWCYIGLTLTFGFIVSLAMPYGTSLWDLWDVAGPYVLGNLILSLGGTVLTIFLFFNQRWVKGGLFFIGIVAIGLGIYFEYANHAPHFSLNIFINWAVLPIILHGAILTTLFCLKDENIR